MPISPQDPDLAVMSFEIYPEMGLLGNVLLNFIEVYLPFYNLYHTVTQFLHILIEMCHFPPVFSTVAVPVDVRFCLLMVLICTFSNDWLSLHVFADHW